MNKTFQLPQNNLYQCVGKKIMVTTALIAVLTTSTVNATESTLASVNHKQEHIKNENVGMGTGAVIGAIVAGPVGAFVAGIGGVFIAKFVNVNDDNEELNIALAKEKQKQLSTENYKVSIKLISAIRKYISAEVDCVRESEKSNRAITSR